MRFRSVVGLLLLLAFGAAAAALLRGTTLPLITSALEAELSEALNRPVYLRQAPWIQIGTQSRVRLRDLSIANAPWAEVEPLLHLGEAEVTVAFSSLFSRPLIIERLAVDGLDLRLVTNEAGDSNLPVFAGAREQDEAGDKGEDNGPTLLLRALDVRNVTLLGRNERTGNSLNLSVDHLEQTSPDLRNLSFSATGSLQERPWNLEAKHSGIRSLVQGTGLEGSLTGALGDLNLDGAYRLDDATHLENFQGRFKIEGPIPPRIADLSPLLDPHMQFLASLRVEDIDPGISVDARIESGALNLTATGQADDPGDGDGLDLDFALDAASLPRLANALGLGPTDEIPLSARATLRRNGRDVTVDGLRITAAEHHLEGQARFPLFPGTTDANLDLQIAGPDYAFYQRLFERPFALHQPYEAHVNLAKAEDGREELRFNGKIGRVTVDGGGLLGMFPSYRNSDLTLKAHSDSLAEVGNALEITLPDTALDLNGRLSVTDAGVVQVDELNVRSAEAELRLAGRLNTYPELDDLDLTLALTGDSLGKTSQALGFRNLGDVPLAIEARATGRLRAIALSAIDARIGESRLRSTAGALRSSAAGLESDLELQVSLRDIEAILARPGPARLPDEAIEFTLKPVVATDHYALDLSRLSAPGTTGSASLRIGRDFALDADAFLKADLRIEEPSQILPTLGGYAPPETPLGLRASTRGASRRIDITLLSGMEEVLRADVAAAREGSGFDIAVTGSGNDLRGLGTTPLMPAGPLPFKVDATAALRQLSASTNLDFDIKRLELGATQLSAAGRWSGNPARLTASIDIARADLDAWLDPSRGDDDAAPPSGASSDKRLIPAARIDTAILDGPDLDLVLRSGPLGLDDPIVPSREFVDASLLRLTNRDGNARLQIDELRGSRGQASGVLTMQHEGAGVALTSDLTVIDLPVGLSASGKDLASVPKHEVIAAFTSFGETYRDLAANLDGELLLTGKQGVLQDMGLSFATESFLQQFLSALLPVQNDADRDMKVECTVLGVHARSGVLRLNPGFVMRTERVDLSARGRIDLNTERLFVRFDNQARKGLGISAASFVNPYVQISGTLTQPSLGLDVANSALAGGAAVASGGVTVWAKPLIGRFFDRRNPCEVALRRWENAKET